MHGASITPQEPPEPPAPPLPVHLPLWQLSLLKQQSLVVLQPSPVFEQHNPSLHVPGAQHSLLFWHCSHDAVHEPPAPPVPPLPDDPPLPPVSVQVPPTHVSLSQQHSSLILQAAPVSWQHIFSLQVAGEQHSEESTQSLHAPLQLLPPVPDEPPLTEPPLAEPPLPEPPLLDPPLLVPPLPLPVEHTPITHWLLASQHSLFLAHDCPVPEQQRPNRHVNSPQQSPAVWQPLPAGLHGPPPPEPESPPIPLPPVEPPPVPAGCVLSLELQAAATPITNALTTNKLFAPIFMVSVKLTGQAEHASTIAPRLCCPSHPQPATIFAAMATILLLRSHRLPVSEVRGRLERAARSAEQRHSLSWRWTDNAMEVTPPPGFARGARGRVVVSEADVRVEVDLPLSLRPARGLVESRLRRKLDDLLF